MKQISRHCNSLYIILLILFITPSNIQLLIIKIPANLFYFILLISKYLFIYFPLHFCMPSTTVTSHHSLSIYILTNLSFTSHILFSISISLIEKGQLVVVILVGFSLQWRRVRDFQGCCLLCSWSFLAHLKLTNSMLVAKMVGF